MNSKHLKIATLIITVLITFTQLHAAEYKDAKLIDMKSVLQSYGFKDGAFSTANDVVYKISFKDRMEFGKLEVTTSIDTPEEFITAAYYVQPKISKTAQKKIDKEIPRDREGALKLGSMWMKKAAIFPENRESYNKAIAIINDKSGVTDKEIKEYYAAGIEREVMRLGKKHLGKYYKESELRSTVLKPIIDYMANPTKEGLKKIDGYVNFLLESNEKAFWAYGTLIDRIDKALPSKVYLAGDN